MSLLFYQVAAQVADLSFFSYFAPVFAFILVFAVVFGVLFKTEIFGDHRWGLLFLSFIVATVFVSAAGAIDFVLTAIPWFAVLLVSLFFILLLTGLAGKDEMKFIHKPVGIVVLFLALAIFLVSGFVVFSDAILPYLPGPGFGYGTDNIGAVAFFDWLYSPRVSGAVVLLIVAALASWFLTRTNKKS